MSAEMLGSGGPTKELLRLLGSLSPNLMDKPLTYRGLKCLLEDAIAQGNLRAFEEFATPVSDA